MPGHGRTGRSSGQPAARIPGTARTADHPHASRPGRSFESDDAGRNRPAARHYEGTRPPVECPHHEQAAVDRQGPESRFAVSSVAREGAKKAKFAERLFANLAFFAPLRVTLFLN